jgi:hypothetical protein
MFNKQIRIKWAIFIDDLPRMLPTMFPFICQSGFREETRITFGAMLVNRSEVNENLYKGSSKETSYQDSIHLA